MTLRELETYFASIELPKSIQLNDWTFIDDVKQLIKSNVSILKANSGNVRFMPYYNQLVELKEKLKEQSAVGGLAG